MEKISPQELSKTLTGQVLLNGQLHVTVVQDNGSHITFQVKPWLKGVRGVGFADAKRIFFNVPGQQWSDSVASYYVGSGQLYPDRNADPARVRAAEYVLQAAAGRNSGDGILVGTHCFKCGKPLTDPESIQRGIGPVCLGEATSSEHQTKEKGHTHEVPTPEVEENKPVTENYISVIGGQFIFQFKFDWAIKDAVKALGSRFDGTSKTWSLPISDTGAAKVSEFLAEHPDFALSNEASRIVQEKAGQVEELVTASRSGDGKDVGVEGLYPFQETGVWYVNKTRRTFIGDEMSLGKTVQALVAIQQNNAFPAVVVVKSINKFNWEREAAKWCPDAEVDVVFGREPYNFSADIIVINYDILHYHLQGLKSLKPKALVLDESQYAKNHKAKRTQAAKELSKEIRSSNGLVLLLSGTPALNRPAELIPQLQILDRLEELGGWKNFIDRYVGWDRTGYGTIDRNGAKNLQELNERMRKSFYLRRLKKDVLSELPEMTRTVVPMELSNRKEYEKIQADFLFAVKQKVQEEFGDLPSDEYQRVLAEKLHKALSAEELRETQELRQALARGKVDGVIEWAQDFIDQNGEQKLIIFAYHRDIQHRLVEALGPNTVRLMGSAEMSDSRRNEEELRFKSDPKAKVAVASLMAAKEGLNLQFASTVAFVELGWVPADMEQAEARIHRPGQHHPCNSYWFVGRDSFDDDMQALLQRKSEVVDALTNG